MLLKSNDYKINKYAFDCEALLLAGNNAVGDLIGLGPKSLSGDRLTDELE